MRHAAAVAAAALALAVALAGGLAQETSAPATAPDTAASEPVPDTILGWVAVTTQAAGRQVTVDVARVDPPMPFEPVDLLDARWDTPLLAWQSMISYGDRGRTSEDLKAYASHFTNPAAILELPGKMKLSTEAYFQKLKDAASQETVIGLLRYSGHTIVVFTYKAQGPGRADAKAMAVPLVQKGETWLIDLDFAKTDPLIQEQSKANFSIFTPPSAGPQ